MPRLLAMLALSLTFPLLYTAATAAASSPAPGPHPVGFRVTQQYDHARVFKTRIDLLTAEPVTGERARPIQALIWYPAAAKGAPLRYRDYLATMATETDFTLDAATVAARTDRWIEDHAAKAGYPEARQVAAQTMLASRGAQPRSGKFPVVIYAASLSATAAENADLCEYLASQGYLVLSSPSLGPRSRSMTTDLEGLEAQAADIAYLIAHAHSLPQADMAHIGVIGFSWGGLSNLLAAARDDRIGALVSLDGSMRGYREFIDGGKDAAKYVSPARVAIPLLYVGKRPLTVEALERREIQTAYSFLNRMTYSDVYIATMYPMNHEHFASDGLRFSPPDSFAEYTRDEVSVAYGWSVRYVQRFLDAYLKNDAAALAFLNNSPVQNGVPPHLLSMDARRGKAEPPTMENFVLQLHKRGFAKAAALYDRFHADNASFEIDQNRINRWGYDLLRSGRPADGLEIFKLGTHVYPTDGNLFDSMAEAYEATGDKQAAIAGYRRSLELMPSNGNAAARLKALGATAVTP